ncbi:MAG TPA: sialate O-acetylesterase, partial [Fibrobacteria bacterium]|nr:sialate O-acetylesterase [Fibrobacteria bacterium]
KGARLYTEIVQAAKAVQGQVTLGGILCMLGAVEATRLPDTVCATFAADIARLASDIRADLGQPNLPFLMGEYEAGATGRFAPTLPMPALIAEQIRQIPSKLSLSATVDSRSIEMLDDHHYTAVKGQGEWARRAVSILQTRSWMPAPTSMSLAPRRAGGNASERPTLVYLASRGLRVVSSGGSREETLLLIDGRTIQPERNHVRIQP